MGQFEKIVVLTVLFLIAVILVVSFRSETEPPFAAGVPSDLQRAEREPASEPASEPGLELASAAEPGQRTAGEMGLGFDELDAGGAGLPPAVQPEPQRGPGAEPLAPQGLLLSATVDERRTSENGLPEGAALITRAGLEDTWEEDVKLYTWRSGDSYVSLASRFYGDAGRADLLRRFNEGRVQVAAGEQIFVPVFDERGDEATAGRTYEVEDGDSLWVIAKKHYGRGSDWERIFEANLDRLASPDAVRAGMVLRIP